MTDLTRLIDLTRGGDVAAADALERHARRRADGDALALALAAGGPGDDAEARWRELVALADAGHGDLDALGAALDARWPGPLRVLPDAQLEVRLDGAVSSRGAALARALRVPRSTTAEQLARLLSGARGRSLRGLAVPARPDTCEVLADASHVTGLELLDLGNGFSSSEGVGEAGCEHLARAQHLGSVRELSLATNRMGNALTRFLARASFFSRLRRLDLSNTKVSAAGLKQLADASHLGELEVLRLALDKQVGLGGAKALATSRALQGLRELDLDCCRINDKALHALCAWREPRLKKLTLSRNRFGPDGLRALLTSAIAERLEALDLHTVRLREAGGAVLAEAGDAFTSLRELDLSGCELTPLAAHHLAGAAVLDRLETLRLAGNPLGADGACALVASPRLGRLRDLDLARFASHPAGGPELAEALAAATHLSGLEHLVLQRQELGDAGAAALAGAAHLARLRQLDLQHNTLTTAGLRALLEAPFAPRLEVLSLRSNRLDSKAMDLLAGAPLERLRRLDVSWNLGADVSRLEPLRERLPGLNIVA